VMSPAMNVVMFHSACQRANATGPSFDVVYRLEPFYGKTN